jgi:hypothetical protein
MQALSPTGLADSDLSYGFESASPSPSLSDKSCPSQSRISHISDACSLAVLAIVIIDVYGSANLPDSLHRKPAGADRAAVDPQSTSTGPHRPPQWGSVGACRGFRGSARGAVRNRRFRAEAGPLPWGPDPTGGSAAAPGLGPGLYESAGRCAGRCAGRWSQP